MSLKVLLDRPTALLTLASGRRCLKAPNDQLTGFSQRMLPIPTIRRIAPVNGLQRSTGTRPHDGHYRSNRSAFGFGQTGLEERR